MFRVDGRPQFAGFFAADESDASAAEKLRVLLAPSPPSVNDIRDALRIITGNGNIASFVKNIRDGNVIAVLSESIPKIGVDFLQEALNRKKR
jgi:hypothetical protein